MYQKSLKQLNNNLTYIQESFDAVVAVDPATGRLAVTIDEVMVDLMDYSHKIGGAPQDVAKLHKVIEQTNTLLVQYLKQYKSLTALTSPNS